MKRLFLIPALLTLTYAAIAQVGADNALFKFRAGETPREVNRLGTAPEFPFLMNKTSANQVYLAIKKRANDGTEAMDNLNALLMQIGYTNGANDLEKEDVTEAYIAPGTIGNMGSRGYVYNLYQLQGDREEFKAWKIAPNNGNATGALYFFAKCGNAFFPKGAGTACLNVPVEVKPDVSQLTLPASGSKVTTQNKTFVYYARKRHKKNDPQFPVAGLNEQYPSDPVQIKEWKDITIRPETYTVSMGSTNTNVAACLDRTVSLTANVNVEKTSTYTGNYPQSDHVTYHKVSKRDYKMIARKMRNAERKADKIAKRTGQPVEIKRA